jgi:hypothetical protein
MLENPKRDATALTIVDIELRTGALPVYRTVNRKLWLGVKHDTLHNEIMALYTLWRPMFVVIDATGVGAGLSAFLRRSIDRSATLSVQEGEKVIPVQFTSAVKSSIGWDFLGIVGTGRYQDYNLDNEPDTRQFWYEATECEKEVGTGPNKLLKWGVWCTPRYNGLIAYGHDDLLIAAALCAILEKHLPVFAGQGTSATATFHDDMEDIDNASW